MDIGVIEDRINDYIESAIPELDGIETKINQINLTYFAENKGYFFSVTLIHENGFEESKNEINAVEYYYITLNDKGLPYEHSAQKLPFSGNEIHYKNMFELH